MYLQFRRLNSAILAYFDEHYKNLLNFCYKILESNCLFFQWIIPCMLIRAISGLTAVENDSGLFVALAILNDLVAMTE